MLRELPCTVLRLFFRRIEVAGRQHVPSVGPVIFILNHPNALMDPLVLLCRAGRPVSFLAKEPLFRMPVIGTLVRAMDSIPVYRKMDQADTANNAKTFAAARQLLARGGSLALFPEGTSHSDPKLKPFRTGAARIALGSGVPGLRIVPAGLFYTDKTTFRSGALLCFGPAIEVALVAPGPDGEPPAEPVRALTTRLERVLGELTLQADHHEALRLAESADRLLATAAGTEPDLAERLERRQRLLRGYAKLRTDAPDRLGRLASRILRYTAALRNANLTPELLPASGYRGTTVARVAAKALAALLLLLPLAVAGMVAHFPAWLAVDLIANRYSRQHTDGIATVKAVAGLLFYPLTWTVLAWLAWRQWGAAAALGALVLAPLAGWAAIIFVERIDLLAGGTRGVLLALTGKRKFLRLVAERTAIAEELAAVGREFGI
jgi:glycerol-3-phosphate O-acyltransferase/dihydroxyacetone phosphate acyltransferase